MTVVSQRVCPVLVPDAHFIVQPVPRMNPSSLWGIASVNSANCVKHLVGILSEKSIQVLLKFFLRLPGRFFDVQSASVLKQREGGLFWLFLPLVIFGAARSGNDVLWVLEHCPVNTTHSKTLSRRANCWDNAVAESFFATLKTELIFHENFVSRILASTAVFEHIEVFYNKQRRHSTLGGLTPEEKIQEGRKVNQGDCA